MYVRYAIQSGAKERPLSAASNGNASETKANESFDNGVFFDIEVKKTPSKVSKLFSQLMLSV